MRAQPRLESRKGGGWVPQRKMKEGPCFLTTHPVGISASRGPELLPRDLLSLMRVDLL